MGVKDQRFEIIRGASRVLKVTCRRPDGSLYPLSEADSITWVLSRGPDSPAVLTKTVGGGVVVTGPGTADVTITRTEAEGLEGSFQHECRVVKGEEADSIFTGYAFSRPSLVLA
jgi:hypothetical protein